MILIPDIGITILSTIFGAFLALLIHILIERFEKKERKKSMDTQTPQSSKSNNTKKESDEDVVSTKYKHAKEVLFFSMIVMCVAVAADIMVSVAFKDVKNDLINSAFEAFKLITMTVLGYVFGSGDSKK